MHTLETWPSDQTYWQWVAAKNAHKDQNACDHRPFQIEFGLTPLTPFQSLKCRCMVCDKEYPELSKFLLEKYREIYKIRKLILT